MYIPNEGVPPRALCLLISQRRGRGWHNISALQLVAHRVARRDDPGPAQGCDRPITTYVRCWASAAGRLLLLSRAATPPASRPVPCQCRQNNGAWLRGVACRAVWTHAASSIYVCMYVSGHVSGPWVPVSERANGSVLGYAYASCLLETWLLGGGEPGVGATDARMRLIDWVFAS